MSHRVGLVALVAVLSLPGCGGSDSESNPPQASKKGCPNGEDETTALYNLGDNPPVEPTLEEAVEVFLGQKGGDVTMDELEPSKPESETKATFVLIEGEFELARIYVDMLDGGWIVSAYESCKGAL